MEPDKQKKRAPNNRTITLNEEEIKIFRERLLTKENIKSNTNIVNKTLNGDIIEMLRYVPDAFADLIIMPRTPVSG